MIAHQQGVPSHKLLQTAIESLTCMTHRGGIAADGKTGDGWLAASDAHAVYAFCSTQNTGARSQEYLAVGMVFMSRVVEAQARVRAAFEAAAQEFDFNIATWRVVPTQPDVCGEIALEQLPQIEQVFLEADDAGHEEVAAKLFMIRRRVEMTMADDQDFYIAAQIA